MKIALNSSLRGCCFPSVGFATKQTARYPGTIAAAICSAVILGEIDHMAIVERAGEAFELDDQLTVLGARLNPGDPAPPFTLEHFDNSEGAIKRVNLSDTAGSVRLLNVINSLDTPVCHIETRRWEQLRGDLPQGVVIYTISMDLPFAQARWQQAEKVEHRSLSAHQSEQFGIDYGVLIKEWRLLQRAVFIVDARDMIAYVDYVADQMTEPSYERAVAAVRRATG